MRAPEAEMQNIAVDLAGHLAAHVSNCSGEAVWADPSDTPVSPPGLGAILLDDLVNDQNATFHPTPADVPDMVATGKDNVDVAGAFEPPDEETLGGIELLWGLKQQQRQRGGKAHQIVSLFGPTINAARESKD
jgi:hypothetical protein